MPLEDYRRKRDFRRTPEPKGGTRRVPGKRGASGSETAGRFVVQKHAARRLHYDFRLELDGVLKSWAVPKGPSLDPAEKRLAVQTEDHPLEYGDFEGVIPAGEYGGGTVLLWDRGEWTPGLSGSPSDQHTASSRPSKGGAGGGRPGGTAGSSGSAADDLQRGRLKFTLHGSKLRGGWMLVRMTGPRSDGGKNWLLIKERDAEARPGSGDAVLDELPRSAVTGRRLEEIAAARDRTWRSQADRSELSASQRRRITRLRGARRAALPYHLAPQLASPADKPPTGQKWLHELQLEGYRLHARIDEAGVRLINRMGDDWTGRFDPIVGALGSLPVKQALLDGFAAVLLPNGTTSLQALQDALSEERGHEVIYHAFDLLHFDGYDLSRAALAQRKAALQRVVNSAAVAGPLRFVEHVEGNGPQFFARACRLGLPGVVCKRCDAPYHAGRHRDWRAVRCAVEDDFVVVGFRPPQGERKGLGALLVGAYDGRGKLRYAGCVAAGFSERSVADLLARLEPIRCNAPPFDAEPAGEDLRKVHWVEPQLVIHVEFAGRTSDGLLAQPWFRGTRDDKTPEEVTQSAVPGPRTARSRVRKVPPRPRLAGQASPGQAPASRRWPRRRVPPPPVPPNVRLTSPDRVFYPERGITKLALAGFYTQIADWILPHVTGRPLTLVRCPQGHRKECFYQRHGQAGMPEHIRRLPAEEKGEPVELLAIDDLAGLISLVQMGVLEIHTWGAPAADLEHPDRLVFDLDPDPSLPWPRVLAAALEVRSALGDHGLSAFAKTTGGKGIHVVVPVRPDAGWREAKSFCKTLAEWLVARAPGRYTANLSKAARAGKIYVDYLRNDAGATSVAAYSTRARPGAPVSVPLAWEELSPAVRSDHYTVENLTRRMAVLDADPWASFERSRRSLLAAIEKLNGRPR